MRAFLAVPGDPAWIESARVLLRDLPARFPRASWTRPESWHLTIRFLGEISEEAAGRFTAGIEPAVSRLAARELAAEGPVLFPPRGRPRTVAVGFDPAAGVEALGEIARAAEAAARTIGCEPETRPHRPHVTLARLRDPWPAAAVEELSRTIGAWRFPAWRVRSVVLFRSRLDAAGAVHTPMREWTAAEVVRT